VVAACVDRTESLVQIFHMGPFASNGCGHLFTLAASPRAHAVQTKVDELVLVGLVGCRFRLCRPASQSIFLSYILWSTLSPEVGVAVPINTLTHCVGRTLVKLASLA